VEGLGQHSFVVMKALDVDGFEVQIAILEDREQLLRKEPDWPSLFFSWFCLFWQLLQL
jgi:hypothetical protein